MRTVTTLCLLLLIALLADVRGDDGAILFSNEIVLENVDPTGQRTVDDSFVALVSDALNLVGQPATPIVASAYTSGSDVVVFSNAWSVGDTATVESEIASINSTFESWREQTNAQLNSLISEASLQYYGRQPSVVNVTNSCRFWGSPVNPQSQYACLRNISTTFLVPQADQNAQSRLVATLCTMLPTNCGLITADGSPTTEVVTITSSTGSVVSSTTYQRIDITILAYDRNAVLATLVNFARYASVLNPLNIAYIRVAGVQVYYEGDIPQLTIRGVTTSDCVGNLWYLIFLIILVPVVIIASQRFYMMGRVSGIKSVKESEQDIRAGVHLSVTPWNAFPGVAAPAGYGGAQLPGYNTAGPWGPPAGVMQQMGPQQGQWDGAGTAAQQWGPPQPQPQASSQWGGPGLRQLNSYAPQLQQ